jgi:hypothetical protein
MATEKEMYELLGRAMADNEFRAKLIADPAKTVKEAGYTLTAEQLDAVKKTDLKGLSEDLSERLSKCMFL